MQQRLKLQQQQALMQQALLQQQQMYHPGMLAATLSQMEPVPSGNLPPGFDSSTCRSVYVGNIHVNVTEKLLAEVFQSAGPLAGCKLIRKEKCKMDFSNLELVMVHEVGSSIKFPQLALGSSYGFVDYHDRASAALAIMTLHGRQLYGQALKVNWAYANAHREDTSGHFNIFVGDLSPEVTDATLFACFSVYPSCSDAKVMWDLKTGRSKGYGFVSFRDQQDAQSAINDMTGKWLGNRQIRCNWGTKGAGSSSNEEKNNDTQNAVILTNGSSDGGQENNNEDAPENSPAYTTVYVGNLPHDVTQAELHYQFHALGAGVIEEVRVQRDKGFGFVRYNTHEEAEMAIQMANGRIIRGKTMKCSWGSKPTPPGTASNPLPPPTQPYQILPTTGMNQGYSPTELLAYQRQLAAVSGLSGQALVHMTGQHGLAAASIGLSSGGSQAMYDAYSGNSSRQHLMYYR
ncbi:oligouridylate-binding protein 1-like [Senna tora]|uniref:Oligouridylate-binding protein 1-like n=1 Tax=Senna tora TaxID=362788 RepID=A0A834U3X7_9FABA|nr:oligouridylate-binding protein 1-like [Senna tora]